LINGVLEMIHVGILAREGTSECSACEVRFL
jgi:hypothetical protein